MPEENAPILVTGASGFIARHILLQALEAGHRVRGTVRSAARAEQVRAALRARLADPAALDRLSFATLDLMQDAGWAEACAGVRAMIHTASPFPMAQPKEADALIRPAVEGTLRALRAARAAGVARVVLTSSVAAVTAAGGGNRLLTEADWTDLNDPAAGAYIRSKTLAERAAWDFVRDEAPAMALTAINPALVLGPPLDRDYGTSVAVVERILKGRDPMLPRLGFGIVDVRDVARMHLAALDRPESAGRRYIGAGGALWFRDIAAILRREYPGRRMPRIEAPDIVLRGLALFDPAIRSILGGLGSIPELSAARARQELGIDFIAPEAAVRATARALVAMGVV